MERDERKQYEKLSNLPVQVDLMVAFDKLAHRVLTERPTAAINLKVGAVLAQFDPNAAKGKAHYTFSF